MKYNDLYQTIVKYYPIGIDKRDPAYHLFESSKLLVKLIDKMVNSNENIVKWETLVSYIKIEFPELLSVSPEYQSLDVCYTAQLLINECKFGTIRHIQNLYCHLSFLGPYFYLYGVDTVEITEGKTILRFDPIITISPMNVYEPYFNFIRTKIKEIYPDLEFLPFYWLNKRIPKLNIVNSQLNENQYSSVFQALFIRQNLTDYRTQGNMFYK